MDEPNEKMKKNRLVEELSELIEKKKAENKLLLHLREAVRIAGRDQSGSSKSDGKTMTDDKTVSTIKNPNQ
jgi:hypothetical protein